MSYHCFSKMTDSSCSNTINNGLNPHLKKPYHPAIKAAMKLAKAKMNRYYSITDRSAAYQIAMGMCISKMSF